MREAHVRLAALALVAACSSNHEPSAPPSEPAAPPPKIVADASIDAAIDAAVDASIDAPADAALPVRDGVTVTIKGVPTIVSYGAVFHTAIGMTVELYSEPHTCAERRISKVSDIPLVVQFALDTGIGATYYTGGTVDAEFLVQPNTPIQVPRSLAVGSGVQSIAFPMNVHGTVTTKRVSRKAGSRVTGTVHVREETKFGLVELSGPFDVELCEELPNEDALPSAAPGGALSGRRGARVFAPKTIHALVRQRGGDAYIHELVAYAKAGVPCPPAGKELVEDEQAIGSASPVGGTTSGRTLLRTPHPTRWAFFKPGGASWETDGIWPGWISIDKEPTYNDGDRFRARMFAKSASYDDKRGSLGGTINAVICSGE